MKQEAPMTQFFKKAVDDRRIIISHISLLAAICQCWKNCGCIHPVPVKRGYTADIDHLIPVEGDH